jgi:hypothetical protein
MTVGWGFALQCLRRCVRHVGNTIEYVSDLVHERPVAEGATLATRHGAYDGALEVAGVERKFGGALACDDGRELDLMVVHVFTTRAVSRNHHGDLAELHRLHHRSRAGVRDHHVGISKLRQKPIHPHKVHHRAFCGRERRVPALH